MSAAAHVNGMNQTPGTGNGYATIKSLIVMAALPSITTLATIMKRGFSYGPGRNETATESRREKAKSLYLESSADRQNES